MVDGRDRILAIDGLRAVAVGIVFLYHAYPNFFPGGFIGVDIFFVISGFVITRVLLADEFDYRRFYRHRFLRIVPPMIPVLVLAGMMTLWTQYPTRPFDILAAGASFMNWVRAFGVTEGGELAHFWSLSIEEQFYLIWPALLGLIIMRCRHPGASVALLMVALIGWQVALYLATGDVVRVYNGLDTRASQLLAGCVLALVPHPHLSRWWPVPIALFALLVLVVDADGHFYSSAGIGLVAILAAVVLVILVEAKSPLNAVLEWPVLLWVGSRSYAIYLWHYPILDLMSLAAQALDLRGMVGVAAAGVLTLLAAELSYRLIEQPARHLRQKWDRKEPASARPA